jgi:hypothetical protein
MIRIRFPDSATEQRALGFLAGRFSFRSWANGETLVPSAALASLALAGIPFSTVGPAAEIDADQRPVGDFAKA